MKSDIEKSFQREVEANKLLSNLGWTHFGSWIFISPKGKAHDLSAADLSKIEMIEKEELFVVRRPML